MISLRNRKPSGPCESEDFLDGVPDPFADLPHSFDGSYGDILARLHGAGSEGGAGIDRVKRREVDGALAHTRRSATCSFSNTTRYGAHTAADFSGSAFAVFL